MLKEKVERALERVRNALKMDGGNIDLISIDEDNKIVKVKLKGACSSCPMATLTLKHTVERVIKEEAPEVEKVEAVE